MVGPIMLLKLMHCKQVCQRSGQQTKQNTSHEDDTSVFIKSENNEEQQKICRVCLKEGDIPIFSTKSKHDMTNALKTFGGISVRADDDYPKFLCNSCNALLKGAILLRQTAQKSNELLTRSVKEQPAYSEPEPQADEEMPSSHMDEEDNTFEDDEEVIKMIENTQYSCKRCDLDFATFSEYTDHRLSVDHENKRITCPICKKTYTEVYFHRHLALHKQETPYMCDVCGKKFIIQGQFTRHRLTHFYNLPFKCTLCPYRGRFSESLKMHMRSHTGEKPYQCAECAHRFVNKSNLSKHMLTHKGTHDYVCSSCGRGFYTNRELDLHFKVDHTGIKDHVCNICGKAFGYRKQMMKHQLKVHKREKFRSGRMPLYLVVEKKKQSGEDVVVTEA